MSAACPRILLVDDSPLIVQVAAAALRRARFDVTTATDMAQLDEVLAREQLDLILMDVQMPELFGDDVAMVLRTVRGLRIPIYLFSSLEPAELRARASDAELDGFICKTDGMTALVDRVCQILRPGQEPPP